MYPVGVPYTLPGQPSRPASRSPAPPPPSARRAGPAPAGAAGPQPLRYSPELPHPSLFAAPAAAARPFEDILLDLLAATRAPLSALFHQHQIPPADAQDLLQESLLVLVERWHTVAHPPAFLYGIVHNRIRRHLDRQRTERTLFTPLDHLEATAADFVRHLESRAEARATSSPASPRPPPTSSPSATPTASPPATPPPPSTAPRPPSARPPAAASATCAPRPAAPAPEPAAVPSPTRQASTGKVGPGGGAATAGVTRALLLYSTYRSSRKLRTSADTVYPPCPHPC